MWKWIITRLRVSVLVANKYQKLININNDKYMINMMCMSFCRMGITIYLCTSVYENRIILLDFIEIVSLVPIRTFF